jgi:hypothetical protein
MTNYTITIQKMDSNYVTTDIVVVEKVTEPSLKEAKKSVKSLMAKYELIRHAGHVVNYRKQIELFTSF